MWCHELSSSDQANSASWLWSGPFLWNQTQKKMYLNNIHYCWQDIFVRRRGLYLPWSFVKNAVPLLVVLHFWTSSFSPMWATPSAGSSYELVSVTILSCQFNSTVAPRVLFSSAPDLTRGCAVGGGLASAVAVDERDWSVRWLLFRRTQEHCTRDQAPKNQGSIDRFWSFCSGCRAPRQRRRGASLFHLTTTAAFVGNLFHDELPVVALD